MRYHTFLSSSIIIAAITLSIAEVPVFFSDNLLEFRRKSQSGEVDFHRSGQLLDNSSLFKQGIPIRQFPQGFDQPEDLKTTARKWKGSDPIYEYEVISQGSGMDIQNLLSNDWRDLGMEWRQEESENVSILSTPFDSSSLYLAPPPLPLEDLKKKGTEMASERLSAFNGRIEFENTEVGYMNGEVTSVRFRFRRIFRGGIVRKDLSYVYLNIDGKGALREIRVKWPKFKKLPMPLNPAQEADIVSRASQILSNASPITDGQQVLSPQKGTLTGMAYAWLPIENGGKIILTPCYSYSGKVEYEGGQVMQPFIDVPQGEKYLR